MNIELTSDEFMALIANADLVTFFGRNSVRPNNVELFYIDSYVKMILETDSEHIYYLTASTGRRPGRSLVFSHICKKRIDKVKQILTQKYGIPESNIIQKSIVITDRHEYCCLDRCVLFESGFGRQ